MSDFGQALLLAGIYRLTILVIGLAFGIMGYMLFARGIDRSGGDLSASSGWVKVTLKNGAPGIFFALFGMSVIVCSLWRGFDISRIRQVTLGSPAISPPREGQAPVSSPPLSGEVWRSIFPVPSPAALEAAHKAVSGQPLTDAEKKNLQTWIDMFQIKVEAPRIKIPPHEAG